MQARCFFPVLLPLTYVDDRQAELDELADMFSAWRPTWRWAAKRHLYAIEYVWAIDRLKEYGAFAGKTILDAGGGTGALQGYMAVRGAHVINIGRREARLEGKTRSGVVIPDIVAIEADLAETGLEEESLDAAVAVSSIEHNPWEHIVKIVRHVLTCLKPGAPFVVTVPVDAKHVWRAPGSVVPYATYMFDSVAFAKLAAATSDLATVATGDIESDAATWHKSWRHMKRVMHGYPGGHRRPYLSGGIVFERR